MTLIVEDGTGRPDAESYVSAADADAYLSARGIATWANNDTPTKEACLRKAAAFMHNFTFKGLRVVANQALDWPRSWVQVDNFYLQTTLPNEVKFACIELAYRASKGELQADQGQQVTQVTVGPITKVYQPGSTDTKQFPAVIAILRMLLKGGGVGVPIVRA
jgi:hypothetical protein